MEMMLNKIVPEVSNTKIVVYVAKIIIFSVVFSMYNKEFIMLAKL